MVKLDWMNYLMLLLSILQNSIFFVFFLFFCFMSNLILCHFLSILDPERSCQRPRKHRFTAINIDTVFIWGRPGEDIPTTWLRARDIPWKYRPCYRSGYWSCFQMFLWNGDLSDHLGKSFRAGREPRIWWSYYLQLNCKI